MTMPRHDTSLAQFLALRARHAGDGQLTLDALAGLVAALLAAWWRGPGYELLLPFAICVGTFGLWGIADRELGEHPSATRGLRRSLSALRAVTAAVGFAAGAVFLMVLLGKSLGTIIS